MLSKKLHQKIQFYVTRLEQFADRPWYPPLLSLLAALDSLIIVIPNDGILIASSMLIPRRWALFALFVAIGSTIGAVALAKIVEVQGLPWILEYYPGIDGTEVWKMCDKFFAQYGLYVVLGIGLTPLMQQPVVIIAGLANIPFLPLTLSVFAGRIIKFLFMAYLASHSPKYLKKIWGLKDEMKDAGIKID